MTCILVGQLLQSCVLIDSSTPSKTGGSYLCKISNNIIIGEENTILKDTILDKSIHIEGSKATVTYTGNNRICIGCLNYDIDYWKSNILSIGQKYEYSDSEIKEYEGYVNKVEEFLNSNK